VVELGTTPKSETRKNTREPAVKKSDVILLFGGQCGERRVSVASAQTLAQHLPAFRCFFWAPDGRVLLVERQKLVGHQRAFEVDFEPPFEDAWPSLKAALDALPKPSPSFFIALHGGSGEDGTVQALLEERQIPFTGSDAASSALAFDKIRARDQVAEEGIRVASAQAVLGRRLEAGLGALNDLLDAHGGAVLKPVADGSSGGLVIVQDHGGLAAARAQLEDNPDLPHLAEAFVKGTELTVGVHEWQGELLALPCSEVRMDAGRAFDYAGKYLGEGSLEITPAEVPESVSRAAQEVALQAHRVLGCRGYSRTDVIVTQGDSDTRPVFLELNTLPGLTAASFIPQQLEAAGIRLEDFIQAQLEVARRAAKKSEPVQATPGGLEMARPKSAW
jgi:D-alanine-D-alanine ligase